MSPPQTPTAVSPTTSNRWVAACRRLAASRLWSFLLLLMGTASCAIYPHPPLVGFATVAGTTLTQKKSIKLMVIIWLINQSLGYSLRNYPRTKESFTWAIAIALGTIMVTILAIFKPQFGRETLWGHFFWLGLVLVGGFALFEGLIILVGLGMGGELNNILPLLGWIFVKELTWTIGLGLMHLILARREMKLAR
jgi:hypothetical protein